MSRHHHRLAALGVGVLAYELVADDDWLITEVTRRLVASHPVLARIGLLSVVGHLPGDIPRPIDAIAVLGLLRLGIRKIGKRP